MAAIEYRGANAVTNFDIGNYIDRLEKKGIIISLPPDNNHQHKPQQHQQVEEDEEEGEEEEDDDDDNDVNDDDDDQEDQQNQQQKQQQRQQQQQPQQQQEQQVEDLHILEYMEQLPQCMDYGWNSIDHIAGNFNSFLLPDHFPCTFENPAAAPLDYFPTLLGDSVGFQDSIDDLLFEIAGPNDNANKQNEVEVGANVSGNMEGDRGGGREPPLLLSSSSSSSSSTLISCNYRV